ncbi:hypothetical protein [Dethiosulfovibrio salsuginis]|uniref:Uncharacterized protein n=1 Tax=Dethiosulfovibrio salsuginis TaxID=561720 RepID=A0A1X7IXK8_9BACT|nr:hypothetical protein [Dethiosulfovibrio salsuginis]SMG19572.1 hypothetical protein SAMN06275492_10624 [Dethiosulfovibrio salsuginis]
MEQRENGTILCSKEIDDVLALQIWRGSGAPRLGIYNKAKERMKPVRFSWLEDGARVLKMKHKRGQTAEYSMDVLEDSVRDLIRELSRDLSFRSLCLKTTVVLQDMAMEPRIVMDKKDFALLPESKRKSLWITDLSEGKDDGVFLPCFDISDQEDSFFERNGEERFVEVPRGGDIRDIRGAGIVTKLVSVDPGRWYMPFQIASVGTILGFSMVGSDGIDFADSLWEALRKRRLANIAEDLDGQAKVDASKLSSFMVSLVRHWHYLGSLSYRDHHDSDGLLKSEGFARKRRFDLSAGQIGDISYVVTFYEDGQGKVALGCKGNGRTSMHDGEMVFAMDESDYNKALRADACGSAPDELYTVVSLIKAWRANRWCDRVKRLVEPALMGHR